MKLPKGISSFMAIFRPGRSAMMATAQSPARAEARQAGASSDGPSQAQRNWLECQLKALPALDRALLQGHWILERSWKELGFQLRMGPEQAQARAEAALDQLRHNRRREAQQQEAGHGDEGRNHGLQAIH